ncbi:unnamed protein product, partial [Ascophyllum nodosum]
GRPISGRLNVVLSSNPSFSPRGAYSATSLRAALDLTRRLPGGVVWIAGGRQLYEEAMPLAQRLYLTLVKKRVAGDVKFPATWRRHFRRQISAEDHSCCTFLTFSTH